MNEANNQEATTSNDVTTFITECGEHQFTVKNEFLKRTGVDLKLPAYDLVMTHRMPEFFHNPAGPAIIHLASNRKEYFLNGRLCDKETQKRIEHNTEFAKSFMDIIENGV